MSRAAAAQATPNLYMVTIKNLDGTTKTVLKSQPLRGAVSCYKLTPDQINAPWFEEQSDFPGNRGSIPAIRRRIALFAAHNPTNPNSKKLVELEDEQKEQARRVALAIGIQPENFLPLDTFEALQDDDTPEIREQKMRKKIQANCSIPTHVLDAALNGDEAIVKMMLEKNASYLLYRGTASDFSGRKYDNLTPFQAALITGDIEMAEMMKPFFARLENGEAEMQKQVAEIFPNGIEEHEATQKRKSEKKFVPLLNELIEAIKNASNEDIQAALNNPCNNSGLYSVLNKFRAAFTDLSHGEKIFNPHYLLAAFEAYVNKFDWNNPDWNKLNVFWCQVIGFVQRFLPATYAQAFAYSLYDIVENKHSCPRSFNFTYSAGFSFYPLTDSCTVLVLGFNFGCRAATPPAWALPGTAFRAGLVVASKLVSNKNNKLSELITPRAQPTDSCIIQ